jgi:hypothetical protein
MADLRGWWLAMVVVMSVGCELETGPWLNAAHEAGAAGRGRARTPRAYTDGDSATDDGPGIRLPGSAGKSGGAGKPAAASGDGDVSGGGGSGGGKSADPRSDLDLDAVGPRAGDGGRAGSAAEGGKGEAGRSAEEPGGRDDGGAGGAPTNPAAGTGGPSGGNAGSGDDDDEHDDEHDDDDDDGPLQCAREMCRPLPSVPAEARGRFSIANCCTADGECGTSINGGECRFTPDSVPDCPRIEVRGFSVPTCCTGEGRCGIDFSAIDRGCFALEEVIAWIGSRVSLPEPTGCEPD